jgi:hypothetical protein
MYYSTSAVLARELPNRGGDPKIPATANLLRLFLTASRARPLARSGSVVSGKGPSSPDPRTLERVTCYSEEGSRPAFMSPILSPERSLLPQGELTAINGNPTQPGVGALPGQERPLPPRTRN